MTSANAAYVVNTRHQVYDEAFKAVYTVPGNPSKDVRQLQLTKKESMPSRVSNPSVNPQKSFVKSLELPWPPSRNTGHISNAFGCDLSLVT